jgi:hypothetical protein
VSRQGKLLEDCTPPVRKHAICQQFVGAQSAGMSLCYDSMFLLATMPLARIAAVIGMWSAAMLSLVW